jgi:hypothetical protein
VKASAAIHSRHDIQVSGRLRRHSGPAVAANYTVTSAIANRPIIGATTGAPASS